MARSAWLAGALAWSASPAACLASVLLIAGSGVTPAATAWLQRAVLDSLVVADPAVAHGTPGGAARPTISVGHVIVLAVALGGVGLLTAVVPYARRYLDQEMRRKLALLAQDRLYRAINAFPGLAPFESPSVSDKIQLVQQVANSSASSFVTSVLGAGQSAVSGITLGATLYLVSPPLAGVVAASAVPGVWAQVRNGRRQAAQAWRASPMQRRQMFYSRLLTDQSAAKEVRLFGLGDFLRGRMLTEMRSIQDGQRTLDRRSFRVESSLSLLSSVIAAAGLIWMVRQVATGHEPLGDVTMFTIAIIGFQGSVSNVITSLAQLAQSLLLFSHYGDIISVGPDLPLASAPRPLPVLRRGIELREVWFRYDEDHPWVLQGLNMFLAAGTSVALVGLNGAGKSTLVKLLCRFYDPARGAILWDGTDIRDVAPAELRQRVGTVFQDYMCYDLTAAENVGLGDLALMGDRAQIQRAAQQAGADAAVSRLPQGYDTMLSRIFRSTGNQGDSAAGVMLSGGQWQRLALARGFMRAGRDLLILDEASSGLDADAEHGIHQRLRRLRAGRTSLLISHRLSAVRDADLICVLAGGRVAEQGTHQELMTADGEYHRLFSLQAKGYQQAGVSGGA